MFSQDHSPAVPVCSLAEIQPQYLLENGATQADLDVSCKIPFSSSGCAHVEQSVYWSTAFPQRSQGSELWPCDKKLSQAPPRSLSLTPLCLHTCVLYAGLARCQSPCLVFLCSADTDVRQAPCRAYCNSLYCRRVRPTPSRHC